MHGACSQCAVELVDKFEMCPKYIATVEPDCDGGTVHGARGLPVVEKEAT